MIEYFLKNYEAIFSVAALVLGIFIAMKTYQVTRQKKEFEQANQIRTVIKEYLELDNKIRDDVMNISNVLFDLTAINEIKNIEHTSMLVTKINNHDLDKEKNNKIIEAVDKANRLQRKYIQLRNLYVYNLNDLIKEYPKIPGDYEKTIIYTNILDSNIGDSTLSERSLNFYEKLKRRNDADNQARLAVSIIKYKIKNNEISSAEKILEEIRKKEFITKIKISSSIFKNTISFLEKEIEINKKANK